MFHILLISFTKWHFTICPGFTSVRGGISLRHLSCAYLHLAQNLQHCGGSIGDVTSPSSTIRFCFASTSGSGTAESNAFVYGCRVDQKGSSVSANSTTSPKYITMIFVEIYFTTIKSWVINTYVNCFSSCISSRRLIICA